MASLFFDGDLRRIYEVPDSSSFTVDGSGYRIYVPDDVPNAETDSRLTAGELWSRWVDYHNANKWATLAFDISGGAYRFTNPLGDDVFATFDLRLINNWQLVPANYQHKWTILGNLFPNVDDSDFDTDRLTVQGVSPRIFFADSLQVVRENLSTTIQPIVDAINAGNTGARIVTINVDDGFNPISSATVRVSSGAESYAKETDLNGQVVFGLDDATWSVAITQSGYVFTPTTLDVNQDTSVSYSMGLVAILPSLVGNTTGHFTVVDNDQNGVADAPINYRMIEQPEGSGIVYLSETLSTISDSNGLVTLLNLEPDASYQLEISGSFHVIEVPKNVGLSFAIPNLLV